MWFWQQNVPKNISFWSKLVAVSALMHGIVLFFLLFLYRGSNEYHVNILQGVLSPNATVVLMPLHKTAPKRAAKKGGRKKQPSSVTKQVDAAEITKRRQSQQLQLHLSPRWPVHQF